MNWWDVIIIATYWNYITTNLWLRRALIVIGRDVIMISPNGIMIRSCWLWLDRDLLLKDMIGQRCIAMYLIVSLPISRDVIGCDCIAMYLNWIATISLCCDWLKSCCNAIELDRDIFQSDRDRWVEFWHKRSTMSAGMGSGAIFPFRPAER